MESIIERCCGLDVHKKSVVACVITPEGQELRSFESKALGQSRRVGPATGLVLADIGYIPARPQREL